MKFDHKLRENNNEEIWQEYCSFLDLSMEDYMLIQNRLMKEQIEMWCDSGIGKQLSGGMSTDCIEEFRKDFPLTTYEDYADILLMKRGDMLPEKPVIWIQTTWEGEIHPIKLAPYSKSMLDTYKTNVVCCLILSTSYRKGGFNVQPGDTMLYGLAPLPYATGLLPLLLNDEINIQFLPDPVEAQKLSFSERNKKGFKLGLKKGIDNFFGVGSVTYFVSQAFASMGGGSSSLSSILNFSPKYLMRYMKAKKVCKAENREMKPADVFTPNGFMIAGTDSRCYKDDLEDMWGIRPVEVFAGTEPGCVGCETWARNGLYLFPDACFYEFIPEDEMYKNMDEPDYEPQTLLMNQVEAGSLYELVVSVFKGGAFMRYRVGDVYRCLGTSSSDEGTFIPRFEYVDRVPDVIDIAGFTRITENSVNHVIALSGLQIKEWFASKEFTHKNRPFFHIYVEMEPHAYANQAVTNAVLKEHMSVYFKYLDGDYNDLKKILGIDPLEITVVRSGSFQRYEKAAGKKLRHINPRGYEKMRFIEIMKS